MDALRDIETLVSRQLEQAREGRDAPGLRQIERCVMTLKSEFAAHQQDRHRLMAENLTLNSKIQVLEQQLAQLNDAGIHSRKPADQYIEHLGAIFVRKPSGRILETPLCRQCRAPLRRLSPQLPYSCSACESFALFRPAEIQDILLAVRRL